MFYRLHTRLEQKVLLLGIGILVTVSIGGIVEITPLYTITPRSSACRACGPTPRSS